MQLNLSVGIPSLKWVQKDWFYLRKGRLLRPCFGLLVYLATRLIVTFKIIFLFCINTFKILQDCYSAHVLKCLTC